MDAQSGPTTAFTYRCLRCSHRLSAGSRPDGCPRCGGWLRNTTLVGQWRGGETGPAAGPPATYECLDCGRRVTAGQRPGGCENCGAALRIAEPEPTD